MSTQIEIDEATGLPMLPEGHYWRVEYRANWVHDMWSFHDYFVSIIRKRRFWFDSYVEGKFLGQNVPLTPTSILERACDIVMDRENAQRKLENANRLIGDYPPKRIGGVA